MADSSPDQETPGTPRWVKGFGIAALVLLGLFVCLHLSGHGFGHHHG